MDYEQKIIAQDLTRTTEVAMAKLFRLSINATREQKTAIADSQTKLEMFIESVNNTIRTL